MRLNKSNLSLFILMSSLIALMIMHPITAFQSIKQYRKNKKKIKEMWEINNLSL